MTEDKIQPNRKIKVLVVDDSAFYRQTLSEMLKRSSKIDVIGVISDGTDTIRFLSKNKPDVIVLDLEMPAMDGFTFLRWLMSNNPLPVLVVSAHSEKSNVFKALELGAIDFLAKPTQRASFEILKIQKELIAKVELAATIPVEKLYVQARRSADSLSIVTESKQLSEFHGSRDLVKVVTIGASTGGPPAVQSIITRLPNNLSATVAIAQHMPPGFTQYFAERLNKVSELPVREAKHGEIVQSGTVYVAPGGHHMAFEKKADDIRFSIKTRTEADKYTPSVDILMKSAAQIYGNKTLGVLLTGMGQDGKKGMRLIKEKGGATLAEAEETAVVFGMPKEAILEGVVDKILPLYSIPEEIIRRCR